ncbi:MAG TPA: glycosyltransferase family 2 protein [Gemmatimonadaceae bacterium]
MLNGPFRLSVAIPVYNEEQVFPELLRRTAAVLDQLPGGPHELVVVDDGSSDRTPELLRAAAARDPRIVGIALSRNFGHQAALSAALDAVSGDATVIMDGDLQDAPEVIPRFLEEFWKGYDVVYARRVRRKESWWLRLAYRAYYRLLSRLADVQLPLDAGDFGLMSRRVVELIRRTPERHRYLRGLRSWVGFRQLGVTVERDARHAGTSKYSLAKLVRLGCDGIFSFSTMPLRAAAVLGALGVAASTLFAAYAVFVRLVLHRGPQGFTALILVITFLSGLNLFFLGVIGEYVGRVFEQVKGRPTYVVGEVVRQGSPGAASEAMTPAQREHAVLPPRDDAAATLRSE